MREECIRKLLIRHYDGKRYKRQDNNLSILSYSSNLHCVQAHRLCEAGGAIDFFETRDFCPDHTAGESSEYYAKMYLFIHSLIRSFIYSLS